jgi:hypothetical protein
VRSINTHSEFNFFTKQQGSPEKAEDGDRELACIDIEIRVHQYVCYHQWPKYKFHNSRTLTEHKKSLIERIMIQVWNCCNPLCKTGKEIWEPVKTCQLIYENLIWILAYFLLPVNLLSKNSSHFISLSSQCYSPSIDLNHLPKTCLTSTWWPKLKLKMLGQRIFFTYILDIKGTKM